MVKILVSLIGYKFFCLVLFYMNHILYKWNIVFCFKCNYYKFNIWYIYIYYL